MRLCCCACDCSKSKLCFSLGQDLRNFIIEIGVDYLMLNACEGCHLWIRHSRMQHFNPNEEQLELDHLSFQFLHNLYGIMQIILKGLKSFLP